MKKFGYKSHEIGQVDNEYGGKHIQSELKRLIQHYKQEYNYRSHEEFTYPIHFFTNPYKRLTEEYIESKDKFKSDLKLITYKLSALFINYVKDHCYLIQELSTPFKNLKALHIKDIRVTIEDFQYLLDSLKCLEDLKFIDNYIFKHKPKSIDSCIKWPQTLKMLTIGANQEIILENNYAPIPMHPLEGILDISSTNHLLLPTHFPNLESLSLKMFDYEYNQEFDDKFEFLRVNPHIKKLSFPFAKITPQLFDIISSFQNLEHLSIFPFYFSKSKVIDNIKSSNPPNLKSVNLILYEYIQVTNFLNKSFLQINYLTVELKSIEFHDLCLFISKLPPMSLLKNLKMRFRLKVDRGCDNDEPLKTDAIKFPKLDSLERMEFNFVLNSGKNMIKIDVSQLKLIVEECPRLTHIKVQD